ncbi:MAG TPA: hypothetical protein VIN06_05355 [Devosia sp.]
MRMGLRAKTLTAVSLLAVLTATPALAQTVTVTNITAGESYQLTVPTVEATSTNLTEAQIRRIFTGDFANNATALADFDAGNITIPEITVTYDVPKTDGGKGTEKATIVYKDIQIADVVDGVAGSASVGSAEIKAGSGIDMTFGAMSTGTFDIGGLLAFYGIGTAAPSEEYKTLYGDFAFEGGSMKGPGFSCTIGGAAMAEFRARPLKTDFNEFAKLAASVDQDETPPPAVIRQFIDFYVDILTAFESTPMTGDGFDCAGDDGKGNSVKVASGAIEMGGFVPGIYPHFAINDFVLDVQGEDAGSVSLGNFTWKQMDFTQPIAALAAAPAELTEAWLAENWRKLIPAIDGLSLADLTLDVPDPENKQSRIQATVGGFDISLADYVNGLPSRIGLSTDNVRFTVPQDEAGQMLHAVGLGELDLSQDIQLHWDRDAKTIVIDTITIDGADLGTIKVSGVIGNATEDLFSADNNVALVASMGLTIKELTLDLDDRGVSGLIIGVAAAGEKQDPAVLRLGFAGLAQAMMVGLIGSTPEAVAASEEIAAFIKSKPQVTVTLKATDEAGIPMPLLMAAADNPAALAGQISVSAKASGADRPADKPIAAPAATGEPTDCCAPSDGAATPDDGVQSEAQQNKQSLKN